MSIRSSRDNFSIWTIAALCGAALCGLLVMGAVGCGGGEEAPEPATGEPAVPPLAPALLDPNLATEKAPELFKVKLETTEGDIVVEAHREWAPNGVDRFYNLVKIGYYTDVAFYRVLEHMAYSGIHGDLRVTKAWGRATIQDDPVMESNVEGMVTFGKAKGPNSRTTQFFINYKDNSHLDKDGYAPFAKVIEGMDVAKNLYSGYEQGSQKGKGPDPRELQTLGNAYLKSNFPELDYIKSATLVP
ncbi:MAG: peptidylprolyl isomerase [Planctomycetota bacterium]